MIDETAEWRYRYDDFAADACPHLVLSRYRVIRHTDCGVWIDRSYGRPKFVLESPKTRKRWACTTQELALESFIERKRKQIAILEHQLCAAKSALDKASRMAMSTATYRHMSAEKEVAV